MRFAGIVLLLALAGCKSVSGQLDETLKPLIGTDIRGTVVVLGFPDSRRDVRGDTIYFWSHIRHTAMADANEPVRFRADIQGTEVAPVSVQCTLQVAADEHGKIKSYHFSGNAAGCKIFLDVLNPSAIHRNSPAIV